MTADPYEILAASLRREQELVHEARLGELAELVAHVEALTAALPETPPASARPHLEEAERSLVASIARVEADLAALRSELARLGRERAARSSYGARRPVGVSAVDAKG